MFSHLKISYKLAISFFLTILLVCMIGAFALVQIEGTILDARKLKTRHLVEAAYTIVQYHYSTSISAGGNVNDAVAQKEALDELSKIRYDEKEYFWVNDLHPRMLMHPYKPELNGKDLTENKDPTGKHLFVEFVNTVKQNNGAGFVDYMWPAPNAPKDAPPIPKVSYVKLFPQWGWIVGSGIYIQDVRVATMEIFWNMLIQFLFVIAILIGVNFVLTRSIRNSIMKIAEVVDRDVVRVIEALRREMSALRVSSDRVLGVSRDTAEKTVFVSGIAKTSSENIQSVSTATEELTASISEISRQMTTASDVVGQAQIESRQATEQVAILSDASMKIGDVVSLINNIASQTNLLALNATIEAARAGEAGKGFVVVANEVKNLATQTAQATSNIGSHIEGVQSATDSAVKSITHMRNTIDQINQISSAIMAAIEEQRSATDEILRSISHTSDGTRQVGETIVVVSDSAKTTEDSAEGVARSVNMIEAQVATLRETVDHFVEQVKAV